VRMSRRQFKRPLGERRYKKLFLIATEGSKTEPTYFTSLTGAASVVHVKTLEGQSRSAPHQVLKRMKDYLDRERLQPSDEAWLVVDQDRWTDDQLTKLHQWSLQATNHGFALSNPKFEYCYSCISRMAPGSPPPRIARIASNAGYPITTRALIHERSPWPKLSRRYAVRKSAITPVAPIGRGRWVRPRYTGLLRGYLAYSTTGAASAWRARRPPSEGRGAGTDGLGRRS